MPASVARKWRVVCVEMMMWMGRTGGRVWLLRWQFIVAAGEGPRMSVDRARSRARRARAASLGGGLSDGDARGGRTGR